MLDPLATSTFEASVLTEQGAGVTVALQGELDLATAPTLDAILASPVVVDARSLLLDLTELDFLDLAGLRVVRAACTQATPPARLVLGGSRARRLFDLTGEAHLIDDHRREGDAPSRVPARLVARPPTRTHDGAARTARPPLVLEGPLARWRRGGPHR